MMTLVLASSLLLVAQTGDVSRPVAGPDAKKTAPVQPALATRDAGDEVNAMAEYAVMKEKTPMTSAARWKLGLWCEKHGLNPEAYVHFAEVAQLDPAREAVWRKLGFKKVGGRWTSAEQMAEDGEQKKADKAWGPRLKKLHKDIHGRNGEDKRKLAQAALDEISDPRAVISLYREFGGGPKDQVILVTLLGQIDRPISTKVLAMLAVYGQSPQVRQHATETLRSRPPRDFLDLLVGLMIDPVSYEVRAVGGPGSPGVLMVEGERYNSARFYAPPPPPNLAPGPGDVISFDASGMPVIHRPVDSFIGSTTQGVPGSKSLVKETTQTVTTYETISTSQLMFEAQRGAVMAQAQLEGDIAAIKNLNENRRQLNDTIMNIAKDSTGQDLGRTPREWRERLKAGKDSPKPPSRPRPKPTVTELAALEYNPVFAPIAFENRTVTQTHVYVDT